MYVSNLRTKSIDQCKEELKPFYDRLGSIYCKAIQDNVQFNRHGWKHLFRHSNGQRRNVADAKFRLGLLQNIPMVIKRCAAVRKTSTQTQFMGGRVVKVTYFEIVHTFSFGSRSKKRSTAIVVVLRKIEDGKIHFWTTRYDS